VRCQRSRDLAPAGANIQRQSATSREQLVKERRAARIDNDPVQPRLGAGIALINRVAPGAAIFDLGNQRALVIRRGVPDSAADVFRCLGIQSSALTFA
jgi:hypothetical protein